ncbi:PaaI family thioesterase [Jeotgalibacillus marinus]|uniref:PaaI family thioesterase n=1 Tax=Jeotgalibacillus marinus TaxID=86667 RepID=A0ABV3Q425_9BACL
MKSRMLEQSTFSDHLGMVRQENDDGAVVISMEVQEIHKDEVGHVSSGLYYTLLDVALGTAVSEQEGGFTVTIDMHVQVFKQEQIKKLVCKGGHININGNAGSGRGDVFDGNGVLVATGMATFKVMNEA